MSPSSEGVAERESVCGVGGPEPFLITQNKPLIVTAA